MELQFGVNKIPCLHQLKGDTQTREQTQELRLTDGMPEIGRVLGAWGQLVIRGKEWRSDSIGVNCGVMAWVLYSPEDGGPAQCMETWIPISVDWDIPNSGQDGRIVCRGGLKSVDARILSGRKLMVRASVCMQAQAYTPFDVKYYEPQQLPEDIQLKTEVYPVCLPMEAGEKAFLIDEELTLPGSAPAMEKMVRCSISPEVTDQKVLGDKAVFRGNGLFHILYSTPEGALASWDFSIPFSQYTELEREYGHTAQAEITPFVTAMETETAENGRIRLKAGFSGQYMIYDTKDIPVVKDAYSPQREITVQLENTELPSVLERQSQTLRAEHTAPFDSSRVADAVFLPGCPQMQRRTDGINVEIPGVFQILYYDREGNLQSGTAHWRQELSFAADQGSNLWAWANPVGSPQTTPGENSTAMNTELMLQTVTSAAEQMPMVTGLTAGEAAEKNPARPSLILKRAGGQDLWMLAKENGSTVEAIRNANHLQDEPEPDKMLLIPVL